MGEKNEMSVAEWLVRLVCATLAFGTTVIGLAGSVVLGMTAVLPKVESHEYALALCMAIALLASFFGFSPMARWLNRGMLHSLTGLEPLEPKR